MVQSCHALAEYLKKYGWPEQWDNTLVVLAVKSGNELKQWIEAMNKHNHPFASFMDDYFDTTTSMAFFGMPKELEEQSQQLKLL